MKYIMERMQGFFEKNWIWIVTLVFTIGVNYATTTKALESKPDKDEVRVLIQEELRLRSYTLIDGKMMEIKITNIQDDVTEMKNKLDKVLQEKSR